MMTRLRLTLTPENSIPVEQIYTAVQAWAISKALDAEFVLLIDEDSADATTVNNLLEGLRWLKVDWDEGVDEEGEFEPNSLSKRPSTPPQNDEEMKITHVVAMADAHSITSDPVTLLTLPPLQFEAGDPKTLGQLQSVGVLPAPLFSHLAQLTQNIHAERPFWDKWQVRKQFDVKQIPANSVPFDWAALRQTNHEAIQRMGNAQLAEAVRPFLEDAYDWLPNAEGWLERVTALIKPHLVTLEDSIEAAEWALSDEFEYSEPAQALLAQPNSRPILARLVAEVAMVVLLDQATAQSILANLQKEFSNEQVDALVLAALTGRTDGFSATAVMGIIGKEATLQRAAYQLR